LILLSLDQDVLVEAAGTAAVAVAVAMMSHEEEEVEVVGGTMIHDVEVIIIVNRIPTLPHLAAGAHESTVMIITVALHKREGHLKVVQVEVVV
jgi:hypothetical protein